MLLSWSVAPLAVDTEDNRILLKPNRIARKAGKFRSFGFAFDAWHSKQPRVMPLSKLAITVSYPRPTIQWFLMLSNDKGS
jgi:hypothetical protein